MRNYTWYMQCYCMRNRWIRVKYGVDEFDTELFDKEGKQTQSPGH